ncbi:nineteen complex-related protein 2-domain-containing protein [Triangularia verruculosa]|uniref:Nineteen complex-related protein 2-domain-containing protein n=1 Tax=Triangularia verruculosa TaxID=2587418 RepID=A0AAN7AY93_9PEZI|nr:nineteen complex-related protein 2-domain-containing protein [Triangularia verruculosa]
MSTFGSKRKARIIQTFDDDANDINAPPSNGTEDQKSSEQTAPARIKFRSKSAKSSALRKSLNVADEDGNNGHATPAATTTGEDEDGDSNAPVVVRPALGRAGSTKQKKRPATSSRLSFGGAVEQGTEETSGAEKPFTPKKTLGQRALENNALRRSASLQNLSGTLPMRFGGGDEDRPKYSKAYLEELQSSTPATPQNVQVVDDGDAMDLDPSELDGALVVQSTSSADLVPHGPTAAAHVLSAAEIRERKDRRARLAREGVAASSSDFISLDSGSDSEFPQQSSSRVILPSQKKKKSDTRLIAEDEDLGEGYDEYVLDNPLALGRKAERDAARRHRAEIAELINAAESDAESDDSEAERRAAYEAAQRRAGMDGLQKPEEDEENIAGDAVPRMKPLPKLTEVLNRMNEIVQGLEVEFKRKQVVVQSLEKERGEIEKREREVQEILNQAGAKYQAVVAGAANGGAGGGVSPIVAGDVAKLVQESINGSVTGQSPLRPLPPSFAGDLPMERGLESFGTPTRKQQDDDEMMD